MVVVEVQWVQTAIAGQRLGGFRPLCPGSGTRARRFYGSPRVDQTRQVVARSSCAFANASSHGIPHRC